MKTTLIFLLSLIGFTSMSQIPQSSNLVGEYKFSGNTDDSSGNSYDGQTYGGPTLTQDRFGNSNQAYSLDGTDDYIHFDDNMLSEWNVNASGWIEESFTISFWAKSSVSTEEPIISFGVHNNGNLYNSNSLYKGMITRFGTAIKMNSNNWPTYSNNAGFSTSGKTYDGNWHHYVLVWNFDTGYRQAYIDGSLVGQFRQVESGIIRKRFAIRDKALSVGRERYGNDGSADAPGLNSAGTYTGSVDEVRIWNLALSSSEISSLYSYDNTSSNYTSETFTNSSGDGQWNTASNWASGSVPTSSTNVSISSGQTISAGASLGNSIYFDGVDDYLSFSNTSGQFEASGDFTFEAWVNWTTLVNGQMSPIFGGQQHAYVALYNQKAIRIASAGTCSGDRNFGSFNSITTDEWHHIAVVRSGSTITWYTDGISNGTTTCSASWFGYGGTMYIGKSIWRSGYFHGYMKNIRYVDGTAVYTSNFTPPGTVSNITNTTFLMNVNSSSTYLTDTSSNGYTVTGHNGPTFTASNGPSGSGNSTTAAANTITVESGGSLTIAKNSDLTISGDFTNNGTVTLNSDADEFASIIVQGSSTGDIVYNRYVNTVGTAEWDLIGAPTDGLSISSFVTTNSTPLATSGSIYAVGEYDNSDNSWTNYTSSTVGAAGNFDIGRGYQMATSSGATVVFTGTVATTDQTQSIINNAGNGGRRWNLVANPYPSYLNANTNAHASNNFLSVNSGVIDSNYSAIYGYNADGSGYTIYNNTTAATYIAPGQAFFVAAASSSATNLSFTEAMQTTTGGDDFIAGRLANTSSELYLKLYEGQNLVGDTKFYFDNNLSLGLDPGYDAGAYNQSSALASRLAEDDQGVNMGINAMGIDSFEQTTIPIVVNRQAGTSFRISLEDLTIPENVEVVLEDTETQTFTDLRAGDFTLNPQNDLSGMGRFYLRLGNTSLGGSDLEESYISIYNPMDKDYITIEGLANIQKANVRLYNIIGQEILSKTLQTGQSTQNISTAGLTTGIYVIKLEVDSTLISKKIVIN